MATINRIHQTPAQHTSLCRIIQTKKSENSRNFFCLLFLRFYRKSSSLLRCFCIVSRQSNAIGLDSARTRVSSGLAFQFYTCRGLWSTESSSIYLNVITRRILSACPTIQNSFIVGFLLLFGMVVAALAKEWLWSELNERRWAGCRVHCVIFHCCLFGRERIFVDSKLIDFHRQCCAKGKWFVVGQTKNRWSRIDARYDPGKIIPNVRKEGNGWEKEKKAKIHQRIQCAIPLSQCSHWINRIIDEFRRNVLSFGPSEWTRACLSQRKRDGTKRWDLVLYAFVGFG